MTSPISSTAPQSPDSSTSSPRGRFLWHEFLARDRTAALAFYPPVTGWTVTTMEVPGGAGAYSMFSRGEVPQCGVMPYPAAELAAGAKAGWLPYMGTEDVDATCRAAVALGATQLMPPSDIPTVGRIAVLRDPEGAHFALYTPSNASTAEETPQVGEFAWHEMLAGDPVAAFAFYGQLFGWEKKHAMDMGAHGIYQMFGRGQFTYGGFMGRAAEVPESCWNCYVRVADLDASCDAIRSGGGTIIMGPHEVPNDDRVVIASDDQGGVFSLVGAVRK